MIKGVKQLFGHRKKKSGGISSRTRPVSFRLSYEDYDKFMERVNKWNGGDKSEYIVNKLDLHRNHHRQRGEDGL